MTDELFFRWAVCGVMFTTTLVAALFRIRAARAASGEEISRIDEGLIFAIFLRLAGASLFGLTLLYLVAPNALPWARFSIPIGVRWFGLALGCFGPILMYWTLHSLGNNLTDTVVTRQSSYLVTRGPYRWVRHPFYTTAAILMASVTLMANHWLIGLTGAVVIFLLVLRTPKEEERLIARFGDAYREYMSRTPRFLPNLW